MLTVADRKVIAYYEKAYAEQIENNRKLKKRAELLGISIEELESNTKLWNRTEQIVNKFLEWQRQELGIDARGCWELIATTVSLEPSIKYVGQGDLSIASLGGEIYGYIPPVKNLIKTFAWSGLKRLPLIPNTVESMHRAFWNCKQLNTYWGDSYPEYYHNIGFINKNNVDLTCTFFGCSDLEVAPKLTDNTEVLDQTFCGCYSLVKVPHFPLKLKRLARTFSFCKSLEAIPKINTKAVKISDNTFFECMNLQLQQDISEATWTLD